MRILLSLLILLLTVSLFGCSKNNEQGVLDSRKSYMTVLQKMLTEKEVPFTRDDEGYIRYSNEYKDIVEKIKLQVDEQLRQEIGTKFEKGESTQYFRKLLNKTKINFRTETRPDGEWTYWHPKNQRQKDEIEMKVVAYTFDSSQITGAK